MTNLANAQPGLLLGHSLFYGIEQEGPRKGEPTVFVGDPSVVYTTLEPHLHLCTQVYLGGNRLSSVNWKTAMEVLVNTDKKITVETTDILSAEKWVTSLDKEHLSRVSITLTCLMLDTENQPVSPEVVPIVTAFTLHNKHPEIYQVKIDWGQRVLIVHNNEAYLNDFSGYHADIPLA